MMTERQKGEPLAACHIIQKGIIKNERKKDSER